jgi:heme/copper-type cytochrome/quinol oxidase subunit 2
LYIFKEGSFYGQCSELCGLNHAFMPIQVIAVPYDTFFNITVFEILKKVDSELFLKLVEKAEAL